MRRPPIVSAVILGWLALNLSCVCEASAAAPASSEPSSQLLFLLDELHAEVPFYYRWMDRKIGPVVARSWLARPMVRRVALREMEVWSRRRNAVAQLAALHTNAWPVIPQLAEDLERDRGTGVLAASVLLRIDAERHPDWGRCLLRRRRPWRGLPRRRPILSRRSEPPSGMNSD